MAEPLAVEEKELADVEVHPITLVAFDQKRYPVRKTRARLNSGLVRTSLDIDPDATEVPLPMVVGTDSAGYMPQIVAFLDHHDVAHTVGRPLTTGDDWDRQFIQSISDVNTLYEIIQMANYMDIAELLQLASARLAQIIDENRRGNLVALLAPRGRELKTLPGVTTLSALPFNPETVTTILTAVSGLNTNLIRIVVSWLGKDNRIVRLGETVFIAERVRNRFFSRDERGIREIESLRDRAVADVRVHTYIEERGLTIVTEDRDLYFLTPNGQLFRLDTGVRDAVIIKSIRRWGRREETPFTLVAIIIGVDGSLSQKFFLCRYGDRYGDTNPVETLAELGEGDRWAMMRRKAGPLLDTKVFDARIVRVATVYGFKKHRATDRKVRGSDYPLCLLIITETGSVYTVPVTDARSWFEVSRDPFKVQFIESAVPVVAVAVSTEEREEGEGEPEEPEEEYDQYDEVPRRRTTGRMTFDEQEREDETWERWSTRPSRIVDRDTQGHPFVSPIAVVDRNGTVYHTCDQTVTPWSGIFRMLPISKGIVVKTVAEARICLAERSGTTYEGDIYEINCRHPSSPLAGVGHVDGAVDVCTGSRGESYITIDNNTNIVMGRVGKEGTRFNLYDEFRRQEGEREEDEQRRQQEVKREAHLQSPEGRKETLMELLATENPDDETRMERLFEALDLGLLPPIDRDIYNSLVERERLNAVISPAGSANARDLYNRLKARMDEGQRGVPVPAPQFGGDAYHRKYLKYKEKYLRLRAGHGELR